jgi:hypothetical protein
MTFKMELHKAAIPYVRVELQMLWNLMGGQGPFITIFTSSSSNTEKVLHEKIREVLQEKFGDKESGW